MDQPQAPVGRGWTAAEALAFLRLGVEPTVARREPVPCEGCEGTAGEDACAAGGEQDEEADEWGPPPGDEPW